LLHPFIPYITEEIWSYLPGERGPLMLASWPTSEARYEDAEAEAAMTLLADLVVQIRNVRNEYKVDPGRRIQAIAEGGTHADLLMSYAEVFRGLCKVDGWASLSGAGAPKQPATVVSGDVKISLPLAGMVDLDAERKRLTEELERVNGQIAKSEKMLANE